MNLCILDSEEPQQLLPLKDRRAQHILSVLKKSIGDRIRVGSPGGLLGWATLVSRTDEAIALRFDAEEIAPALRPVHVFLGTARPIQAARIVKELTILGVAGITFFPTALGEKSYTQSNFYTQREYLMYARDGAEQAGNPRLPDIRLSWSLREALKQRIEFVPQEQTQTIVTTIQGAPAPCTKIVFHPSENAPRLSEFPLAGTPIILAIGTERGWTETEVHQFVDAGFSVCSLGDRILKTETAAISTTSIVLARLGYI